MITVTLPDKSKRQYQEGTTVLDVASDISPNLAKATYGAVLDGEDTHVFDLRTELNKDTQLRLLTNRDEEALEVLRHTAAHIMAQAVQRLFPGTKYAIGPVIKDGFYYDFDAKEPFKEEDLEKIEGEMKKIINEDIEIIKTIMTADEAIEYFKKRDDKYKVELIQDLVKNEGVKTVSIYTQDDFTDLCRGPHIQRTSYLKDNAFKLMKVSGSYWRGDSSRDNLQRIYGTAWLSKKDLNAYLNRLKEAEKRDHRKIGKELDLFSFQEEGPGFPFWHPKGTVIFDKLADYITEECYKRGYQQIRTPLILNESLWHTSGHWDHFKDNMYFTDIDEQTFAVKPMNCPGSLLIFKSNLHSYRELPIKFAELGLVHRHELSGVLHGLFRVRSFTQDDAHVYCTQEQLPEEISKLIDFTLDVYKAFGFEDFSIYVATKPDNAMGSDEVWELATDALIQSLKDKGIEPKIKDGEGAFYGPKIEFNIKDCLERNWQCGTIQVDFSMPERFDIHYEGSDGHKHRPVMVHRAILGSLERFIGILIEHYEGKFPTWISPIQVELIPVSDNFRGYTDKVYTRLKEAGIRVEKNYKNETLKYKIRESQLNKIPYMLVLGEKEESAGTVNVRVRDKAEIGQIPVDDFIRKIKEEIDEKRVELTMEND
jgi:threonyl-tRNA synthetase